MKSVVQSYDKHIGKSDLTETQCQALIQSILEENSTTFLVINGLDECDEPAQRRLVAYLFQFSSSCGSRVKVFIASRPSALIENLSKRLNPNIVDVKEHNSKDIHTLVSTRVRESLADPGLQHLYHNEMGEDQSDHVIKVLFKNAQGMFRWAQMAFEH